MEGTVSLAIVITVAIAVTGWSLNAMREMRQKLNGLPQKIAELERRQDYDDDWRHDVAVPMFTQVQLTKLAVEHLAEKIDLNRQLDEIRKKIG